jgi:hypothetical protein
LFHVAGACGAASGFANARKHRKQDCRKDCDYCYDDKNFNERERQTARPNAGTWEMIHGNLEASMDDCGAQFILPNRAILKRKIPQTGRLQ